MKKLYILGVLPLLLASCFNENVFEKSDKSKPIALYVVNPANPSTTIQGNIVWGNGTETDPDRAYVALPTGTDLAHVRIQELRVPSLASVEPSVTSVTDFTSPKEFWVVAENGVNRRRLVVEMSLEDIPMQLKYGSLTDYWSPMGQFSDGNSYYAVGEQGMSSPWANTNIVAAILNKASCVPSDFPNPKGHVVLTTLSNATAGKTVGSGIASGNLFVGAFRSNSANFLPRENQRKNSDQGIPFVYEPSYLVFEYKYKPGTQVEQWVAGTGTQKWECEQVAQTDSMEMWAVLQHRVYDARNPSQSRFKRVGCAAYISSETVTEWRTVRVPFHYGRTAIENIPNVDPTAYRMAGIRMPWHPQWVYQYYTVGGVNGPPALEGNSTDKWKYTTEVLQEDWAMAGEKPTHLAMTFNSSAGGWMYKGAGADINKGFEGSRLEVRNVRFEY